MREFPYGVLRQRVYGANVETFHPHDRFGEVLVIAGWHRTEFPSEERKMNSPQYAPTIDAAIRSYRAWPVPPPRSM